MVDFRAFKGWRPMPDCVEEVAAVPYDVVNTAEARALVADAPRSMLRVTRPDVDLPDGASLYDDTAYAQARQALQRLVDDKVIVRDPARAFYAYAQTMNGRQQIGLMGTVSALDYAAGRIKKHEFTRPKKEDDRMRHIEAARAHLGPVFLTFRATETIAARMATLTAEAPEVDFVAPDGVRHTLWPVDRPDDIQALEVAFAAVPALYIADGHHRAAAASRVGAGASADEPRGRFLAVAFPHDQLAILPYNRVVLDLNGHTESSLLEALEIRFEITPLDGAIEPESPLSFSMYLGGKWRLLTTRAEHRPDPKDPVARLDVSYLQDYVLAPLLGIEDPRTSTRVDFVGGIRGLAELERRAGAGGVAFAMHPTALDDLMDIADAGEVMPPKSTWFEPKLRTGLVINRY